MNQDPTRHRHAERTVGDVSSTEQLTNTIVDAVADVTDTKASNLDVSLYDAVEPDALSSVLEASANCHVSFAYGDCGVSVSGDGTVLVDPDPAFVGSASEESLGVTPRP